MTAYYNEFDPFAAAWLRNLIAKNLIAPGDVDERSIVEVKSNELKAYTQCHFFAGIGGWSLALRLAGWSDARPVWSGSCPCQPFSAAGRQTSQSDERHLWPHWARLISESKPAKIFGEQVASAIAYGWLDDAFADMEAEGYACAAAVLPANGIGAPHRRDRLFFFANSEREGWKGLEQNKCPSFGASTPYPIDSYPFPSAWRAMAGDFSHLRLSDGVPLSMERSMLRGYGNAIVPQIAAEFIKAAESCRP